MFFFEQAKDFDGPALVHVLTTKGKGYAPAERDPDLYHGVPPFDVVAGVRPSETPTFSTVFGGELVRLAATNDKICAVTAAMPDGTGLSEFAKRFPNRFFDEGIAEAHALTMSAGLAKQGMRPVFAVYSTFLQRAFDSLLHDVCILSLPVVIVIDRAGLVGEDGETHHGTFDLALLQTAPNLEIYCPSDFSELKATLQAAFEQSDHPVAIRYPRGGEAATTVNAVPAQKSATPQITVVSYGAMSAPTLTAIERSGIAAEFVKLVKVKPLDVTEIAASAAKTGRLAVVEDVAAFGCVGERIISELAKLGVVPKRVLLKNCGTNFVTHGSICDLHTALGLDPISLAKAFQEIVI
jgi:1-deoxy-D-xylulose-5-phosphate synthase